MVNKGLSFKFARRTALFMRYLCVSPMCLRRGIFPAELCAPAEAEPFPLRLTKLRLTPYTQMAKYKLEYIWLDGYEPVPNLRSKTKIVEYSKFPKLDELPWWGFDGSSTRQAEGKTSDCMLKP